MKTPITYRWISALTFAPKTQISAPASAGEDEHPVREDEPVAQVHELTRGEAVPREQRREPGEALERRVRREYEHSRASGA